MVAIARKTASALKQTPASRVNTVYAGSPSARQGRKAHGGGHGGGHGAGGSTFGAAHASHGGDEELWIFSYADMITILMMFFILLLSVSTLDVQKFEQLKNAISTSSQKEAGQGESANAGQNARSSAKSSRESIVGVDANVSPSELLLTLTSLAEALDVKRAELGEKEKEGFLRLSEQLQKWKAEDAIEAALEAGLNRQLKIALHTKDLFTDQDELRPKAVHLFQKLGRSLKSQNPAPQVHVAAFLAQGKPLTKAKPSEQASRAQAALPRSSVRAAQVFEALVAGGMDPNHMSMAGYGHWQALAATKDVYGNPAPSAEKWNERLEITLTRQKKAGEP